MSKSKETRAASGELRVDTRPGKPPVLEGHAAVFNEDSQNLGGFIERIEPGAFARTIEEGADVRALVDHDPSKILGRTGAGTLEVSEDEVGLRVRITPPDTTAGRDITESIRRGDVSQMSFGFVTRKDAWEIVEDGPDIRTLHDVDLMDVSPVTFPAYPDTEVAVRSHEQRCNEARLSRAKAQLDSLTQD